MSSRLAVALLGLGLAAPGCRREEPPAPLEAVERPAPPPASVVDPLDEALARADVGEHRAALAALEVLLPTRADDTLVWAALEREAVAAGAAGDLLDRLSTSQAVGGQRARHFALRAALAIEARRPDQAIEAADLLATEDPGAAAAFRAWAAQAGATLEGATLDPTIPADALAIAASARDERTRRASFETARSVPGWRAALLRGELARAAGDGPGVAREVEIALADPDPRARLGGLALRLEAADDPAQVAAAALEAARAAAAWRAGEEAAGFLARAVAADLARSMPDGALQAARELVSARPLGDDPVTARMKASLAEVALLAGEAEEALHASTHALAGEMREGPRRDAAWSLARAAWRLCSLPDVEEAIRALPEAEAAVARGLAAACEGDVVTARSVLQPSGLPPAVGVDVALARALAWMGRPQAVEAARQAVTLADEGGRPVTRVEARLALERHARIAGQPRVAAEVVADLERIAPTPAMRMEACARRMALGLPAPLPPADPDEPAQATAWRAFGASETGGGEPPAVAAWAAGRRALGQRDWAAAARWIRAAMVSLPVARQGRWTPPLALDGADGPAFDADAKAAASGVGEGAEDVILALHEWSRFRQLQRIGAAVGDDFTRGMDPEKATAFRAAWTREHARSLMWLAGTGPFPREERGRTAQALAAGRRCDRALGTPPSAGALRSRFPGLALISIRLGAAEGEMLVLTPTASRLVLLADADGIRRLAVDWRAALEQGRIATGQRTDPVAGDALRAATIDRAGDILAGLPHYVLALDADLLLFPWSTLPEQSEGRRFLVDIRTIETTLRLGPPAPPPAGYRIDFYGTGEEETVVPAQASGEAIEPAILEEAPPAPLPRTEIPSVAGPFRRGYVVLREGAEASAGDYRAHAGGARFIHLAGLTAAPDGGLAWATSRLALPDLRCTPLDARLVTLSRPVDPLQQVARAHALLDAGARSVLVALWEVPEPLGLRYLTAMYESLSQDRPPVGALLEARRALRSDEALAEDIEDPSSWGAYLLLGVP
ncbi:MAG: CHAT domain-containing protein [Deltaproteobacteria bacterium]|nr:CHAT domain-containing protein [Deltaproteobacteria bacterium]